jgi:hypothetical protein
MQRNWMIERQSTPKKTGPHSTKEVIHLIEQGTVQDSAKIIDVENDARYSLLAWLNAFSPRPQVPKAKPKPLHETVPGNAKPSEPKVKPEPLQQVGPPTRAASDRSREHYRRENFITFMVMMFWVLFFGGCAMLIANHKPRKPDPYWDYGEGRLIRDEQEHYESMIPRGR